jgi:hypothetical protein
MSLALKNEGVNLGTRTYRNGITSGTLRFKASTRRAGREAYAWRNTTLGTTEMDQEVWDIRAVNVVLMIDAVAHLGLLYYLEDKHRGISA